ncbi:hypothetical protein OL229_04615 [Neisseriaceae bacterium JH1-16]|nr:hypothetical protein [Neisseriaceae bacterium JH1-16]
MSRQTYRIEHDLLGDKPVPADACHGVQSLLAAENFPITGSPMAISSDSLNAQAAIKQAAALMRAIAWTCEGRRDLTLAEEPTGLLRPEVLTQPRLFPLSRS